LISTPSKEKLVQIIDEASSEGARLHQACLTAGISYRSYLRWKTGKVNDGRLGAEKQVPRKLSIEEAELFYQEANKPEYREQTPGQIVASLLEKGIYFGSERTLYRILKAKSALVNRTESRKPGRHRKPPELRASGPNQVWTWDITWLKTDVKGIFVYGYAVIDIFSRMIVGWTVEQTESPELARNLYDRIIRDRKVKPQFVHADNGGPMKGLSLVAFLTQLQVGLTYSRPRVSDDNPFIESFFRTVKYHVSYPKAFLGLDDAREWFATFIDWYNMKHRHSGIGYVTPNQKHTGADILLFFKRQITLDKAAKEHPERFVSGPRTVAPERIVILNKTA
jgi:transposase InsO family protein